MSSNSSISNPSSSSNQSAPTVSSHNSRRSHQQGRKQPKINIDTGVDSSQLSMRTFIQLDTPQQSDDEDSTNESDQSVSPTSNHTPPSTGTRWTRFFPELSSHFSLTSPNGTRKQHTSYPLRTSLKDLHSRKQHDMSEHTERNPASPSSAEEIPDDASSCYSRRTSLTSVNSEYMGDYRAGQSAAYKSADAFSIISPVTAGVFDDTASLRKLSTGSRASPASERRNKPLPKTPSIRLAPLSVPRNPSRISPPPDIKISKATDKSEEVQAPESSTQGPTLHQAAEELEDVLAGITTQSQASSEEKEALQDPLQISRSKGDMIPTRPAPTPPTKSPARALYQQRIEKERAAERARQAKKAERHRMLFSFPVRGFVRRHGSGRTHLRSLSSSNMRPEMTSHAFHASGLKDIHETSRKDSITVPICSGYEPHPLRRPSSFGSERELRQNLPRLETAIDIQPIQPFDSFLTAANPFARAGDRNKNPPRSKRNKIKTGDNGGTSSQKSRPSTNVPPQMTGPGTEMVYELEASPLSKPNIEDGGKMTSDGTFPVDAPDEVILSILNNSSSLGDLFNFAVINRQFYRVYKKHELQLMKNVLFTVCPPAWELREMSPPWDTEWQVLVDPDAQVPEYSPAIYLRRYAEDIFTLAQLKSLILARCGTFLRHDTIRGLAGIDATRAEEVDEAFWRIWTFCRVFGCGKNREDNLDGQIDWLNGGLLASGQDCGRTSAVATPFSMHNVMFEPPAGFGRGNRGGLSQSQLYDMTEIWTCLSVFLQPIHGKCAEAREVGIFDGFDISEDDKAKEEETLEEWTAYILTLGLSAIATLGTISPSDTTATTFARAQSLGLTRWEQSESETSRSSFLKEAVSKAYKLRELEFLSRPPSNRQSTTSERSKSPPNSGHSPRLSSEASVDHRQRQAAFAAELRNQISKQNQSIDSTFANERPLSTYSRIMNTLDSRYEEPHHPPPVPRINTTNRSGLQMPQPVPPDPDPQVPDPVDRAIRMMVQDLGFTEADAKWALKYTDTGEGIDVDAAVSLLYRERKMTQRVQRSSVRTRPSSIMSSAMGSRGSKNNSGWRWA